MQKLPEALLALHSTVAVFGRDNSYALRLSGPDAERYLHARLSQDIKSIAPGEVRRALLLTPQGKLLGQSFVLKGEGEFIIIPDPVEGEAAWEEFCRNLLMFKVADRFDISKLKLFGVTALGPENQDIMISGHTISLEKGHWCKFKDGFALRTPFGPITQTLVLTPTPVETPTAPIELFHLARILSYEPLMAEDITEQIFAGDLPLEEKVSFNKGCYTGQEVVEMTTSRGKPNRRLTAIQCDENQSLQPGTELESEGRKVGFVRTTALNFGLAFVKYDISLETPLSCNGLRVTQLPPWGSKDAL